MAALDLMEHRIATKELSLRDLLLACKEYFDRNCTKLYCFHDLCKYLIKLDRSMQDEFQVYVSEKVVADQSEDDQKQVREKTIVLKFLRHQTKEVYYRLPTRLRVLRLSMP